MSRIGYGCVKYSDLKQHRITDYQFSYDKMLQLNGNTAVYLMYSYARIRSIARKAGVDPATLRGVTPSVGHPKEVRDLVVWVFRLGRQPATLLCGAPQGGLCVRV